MYIYSQSTFAVIKAALNSSMLHNIYIYTYIYVCVCVCVCVSFLTKFLLGEIFANFYEEKPFTFRIHLNSPGYFYNQILITLWCLIQVGEGTVINFQFLF